MYVVPRYKISHPLRSVRCAFAHYTDPPPSPSPPPPLPRNNDTNRNNNNIAATFHYTLVVSSSYTFSLNYRVSPTSCRNSCTGPASTMSLVHFGKHSGRAVLAHNNPLTAAAASSDQPRQSRRSTGVSTWCALSKTNRSLLRDKL